MADVANTDVTYTIVHRDRIGRKYFVEATLTYGDGVLTYPSGGIPLINASLGFRRGIEMLTVLESGGNVLLYEWDRSANTIRIFTEARVEQTGGATAVAATTLEVYAIGW